MSKRGQVTIFIVMGILVLMTVAGIMYLAKIRTTEELKAEAPKNSVSFLSAFVSNCLEKATIIGMETVLSQGGYYQFPPNLDIFSFNDEKLQVPIYFLETNVKMPAISEIEKEVAMAATERMLDCTGQFETFTKQSYMVTAGEPNLTIHFAEETLAVVEYPLVIKIGGIETALSTFSVSIPFNFPEKYNAVKEYLSKQEADPQYFLVGELSSKAYEKNFGFGFKQADDADQNILISLSYPLKTSTEPLIYNFAAQFKWAPGDLSETEEIKAEETETSGVTSLQLFSIPSWNITSPGVHTFQVNAKGEDVTFKTDDPDNLLIGTKTGVITLSTENFPNDEYLYYVGVNDAFNRSVITPLYININVNAGNLPIIAPIEKQKAKVGEEFRYRVEVANPEGLLFTTDSYLFGIDKKSGEIKFTPKQEDRGTHSVRINVENDYGKTWHRFELEIP